MRFTSMPAMALVRAEFLRSLRGVKPYAFLALLVLVGWFIVWANYPAASQQLAMYGRAAEAILMIFLMVVLASAGLFVPALAATAIVSEREQETYDQLSMTLIPPKGMIAAKFLNAVGIYLAVVIGAVPVLGSVFFMVGLEIRLVLASVAILLIGILSVAAIGIAASAYARRSLEALILAYLASAFLMGGHDFLLIVADEVLDMPIVRVNNNAFMTFAIATSPPVTLAAVYENWGPSNGLYWAVSYHAAVMAACFAFTMVCIRRGPRRAPTERGGTRWLPWYGRRFRAIKDSANAMAVKELRWGLLRRRRSKVILWLLCLAIFLVINGTIVSEYNLYNRSYQGDADYRLREAILISFLFFMGILLPATPLFLTNLLTKERDVHTMDMLRVTLLTSREIVLGKMLAGLRGMTPIVASFAVAELLFAWEVFWREQEFVVYAGMVTTAVSMLFTVGVSAYAGAAARRTATGLVAAFAAALFAFLGLPLLGIAFCEAAGIPSYEGEFLVSALSPITSLVVHIGSREENILLWLFVMAAYSAMGILLLLKAVQRYAKSDT